MFPVILLLLVFLAPIVAIIFLKKKEGKSGASAGSPKKQYFSKRNEFDPLMTAQLIALYKKDFDKKYMDEYIRRLVSIGFGEEEATNLFIFESMIMKHDSITMLQSPDYLCGYYFGLQSPFLTHKHDYYVEHQMFTVSEVTKIWDEAEWHFYNSHEKEMPDSVWHEIYTLSRKGGAKLIQDTLRSIADHSSTDFDKIIKYSVCEQNMLFKYKWNKAANEKHPYH